MNIDSRFHSIRGMSDVLPEQASKWEAVGSIVFKWLKSYGYQPILTPILEKTDLFSRAIGAATDIVEKEMYSFTDVLNGDALSLRPEGTVSCVRAALESNLLYQKSIQRLYYWGPMFRHERPQKGRSRQFYQLGLENFGLDGPDVDVELMAMWSRLWSQLGLACQPRLEINCLGSVEERQRYKAVLIEYLKDHEALLDESSKARLLTNPLRVLDSKNPQIKYVIDQAPRLLDFLGERSSEHFDQITAALAYLKIPFVVNSKLVRGLDYYNLTVFEWVSDQLGAQGTICAGGRYDGLFTQLGSKPVQACGCAMGWDRLMLLLSEQTLSSSQEYLEAYLVHDCDDAYAPLLLAEQLRDAGIRIQVHFGGGSFKTQFKKADQSQARFALILGNAELSEKEVSIKALRSNHLGQQQSVKMDAVAAWLKEQRHAEFNKR